MLKEKMKKIYKIFSFVIIPIITTAMIVLSYYKFEEILIFKILPVFLAVWFLTLVINILYEIIKYVKVRPVIQWKEIAYIIYFSFSIGLFSMFSFVVLFTRSFLLGGFHAQ